MSQAQSAPKAKSAARARPAASASTWRVVWDYLRAILLAVFFALLIRQFVIQAFRIPSGSMEKTLLVGDFLFVDKFVYGSKSPERIRIFNHTLVSGLPVLKLPAIRQPRQGDIIVFQYPNDPNQDYIKRCVAVAGDSVEVREGVLYVNGSPYEEHTWHDPVRLHNAPYNKTWPPPGQPRPYVVPPGKIFMMGDNRYNSADSRAWGPLDLDLVKGRALFLYWSWDRDRLRPRLERIGRGLR